MNMLNSTTNAMEESVESEELSMLYYDDFVFEGVTYHSPTYAALGLAGESGEVGEAIKKLYRKHGEDWNMKATEDELDHLKDELGDVLWYITRLAQVIGTNLLQVAEYNVEKLNDRRNQRA